ncbi:phage head closure protein [Antarcticirhabdus aurantiaca]|uniref:Phage head closure protein n=1 Tax=Antarcticirhabdus aurantiaca TaxID=2606717 RepID=A0ACD4NVU5_9HYPH|nr:phage head closure protein [Jeongeuplla avenae]
MRAGSLDRSIQIDAYSPGAPDEYGVSQPGWSPFLTIRAQLVTMSTEEFLRASGEASESVLVFRTRYLAGVTNAHRLTFESRQFDIKEVKEIGRRAGLELRCEERRV